MSNRWFTMTDLLVFVTREAKILIRCIVDCLCKLLSGLKIKSNTSAEHFFWGHSIVSLDVIFYIAMNFHVLYCFCKSSYDAEKCCFMYS